MLIPGFGDVAISATTAGALAGQVEMAIDDVLGIANNTMGQLEDAAESGAAQPMRNMSIDNAAFSPVPAAQDLAAQHEAAKQVFTQTVEGVLRDLAEFRQALLDSAASMRANDQSAEETLMALDRRYEGHVYVSDASFEDGRNEHAAELDVEQADDAVSTEAAAPADASTEPAGSNDPAADSSSDEAFG